MKLLREIGLFLVFLNDSKSRSDKETLISYDVFLKIDVEKQLETQEAQ